MPTRIEWTDETWNPTVGCSRVSPGCDNCYAITTAHRAMSPAHKGLTIRTDCGPDWSGQVRCLPGRLDIPTRWRTGRRVFVGSMSDLFGPEVPDEFIARVFAVMHDTPRHTYQLLTKRPGRMAALLADPTFAGLVTAWVLDRRLRAGQAPVTSLDRWPLPNVWAGTSIESDRYLWRADRLRNAPAALRWLSLEPLLGPLPSLDLEGIGWVVAGGESGPRARPMHPDWVRDIRDRCTTAGVPFLFKQWGTWTPLIPYLQAGGPCPVPVVEIATPDGSRRGEMAKAGKKTAGRLLDGRTWHQIPGNAEATGDE